MRIFDPSDPDKSNNPNYPIHTDSPNIIDNPNDPIYQGMLNGSLKMGLPLHKNKKRYSNSFCKKK